MDRELAGIKEPLADFAKQRDLQEELAAAMVELDDRLLVQEAEIARWRIASSKMRTLARVAEAIERLVQSGSNEDLDLAARIDRIVRDAATRLAQADATVKENRRELLDQQRRLGLLLEDVRKRLGHPFSKEEASRLEKESDHLLDSFYVAFEDRFRGTRADIKSRQAVYLPLLHEAHAGTVERPVIDVGCGRGEWLELLRENSLTGRGIDLNRTMVELCTREFGLNCEEGDAVEILRNLPAGSAGAVTGFHIIEHLPFKQFIALLDESLRVLAAGGVIVFETPNPANLLVGSRFFYLDPTHRNPMPAEMTAMAAEARGFVNVEIRELHPYPATFEAEDKVLARQLERFFFGPQDYALVAHKA
jgi:O-antigen chain-terminating methyltransferase